MFFVFVVNIITNYSLRNLTFVSLSQIIELDENNFTITLNFKKLI